MAARAPQLLILAALLSAGFSEPVTQPTHEDLRESINSPMPYGFKYEAYGEDGGGHTREESADGSGRVVGSYTIFTREGLLRRVFYEADHNGFRAHIETNEPGTKTSNPADVTIVSTASEGGGGTADAPLPNAATTRPVKTTSPAAGGTTNQTPETTTDLPPGYVLPDRYRPNASRRPPGSELLTSRILTLDKPVDGNQVYPGRPGFESDTDVPSPPVGIHTGLPPAGIVPVGPVQVTRVPGRPGSAPASRPRPHVNYVPSKDTYGPSRPSYDGPFRIPAGSSGGIFSPSQLASKGNAGGPQALDQTGHGDGYSFSADRGSGIPGPGLKTTFPGSPAAPRGQGLGSQPYGPHKYGPEGTGAFRDESGVRHRGPQYEPPGLGAPLFTRVTQGSSKFPGRVDYGSRPGFPGASRPAFPGTPGVPSGVSGGTRPSFGSRGPFGGPRFGPGGSPAGAPLDQFGGGGPAGNRYDTPGQPFVPGGFVGSQGPPPGAQGGTGAAIDGGDSGDSSNEDGFAPNDPRRPFLFRNEDQRPSAPVSPSGGQQPGTYAIRADNGKIESVSFQPGTQRFQGPDRRFQGNRGNVPRGPFRRPAFGGTRRDDPFRPYKPRPIESGHPEPVFVPQDLSGPGSRTTPFDTADPQRIGGSGFPQQPSSFGGQRPGGFSTGRPYRNRFPSGGPYPATGQQDQFDRTPQQSLTPYAPGTPPVPAIANVGSVPNPRNHFANRVFDRTPADTLGRPVGQPPLHPPSLIGMEIIRYGPHGPQVHRFNGSAVPGSLAPPENLEFRGPLQPSRFPGSVQRTPLSANRLVPRPPLPIRGNVNRVLYSEAPPQPTFPRRLGEPKGPEEDFGGAFEGLIRDERPDLLELRPKQKPSGAVSGKAGGGLDFLEELLPFYEKDSDINKKGNEAAGENERKPVVHEPIVPEHRDLLCDDDDPRFSDPRKPGCIKKPKPLGGDAGGAAEPDGKNNEAPIDADEEFLNYRNPFSGVLPSPGAAEKVDRDGKNFQRPFLDGDRKVIPVLIDRNQPNPGTLEGTVEVTRNKLSPGADEAGVPGRSSTPELGAESPIEGRRAFGNNGVSPRNFGVFPGPGLAQGFGGPSTGKAGTFPSPVPPPQDGNLLTFQNIPQRGVNDLRGIQDPFRRNFQPFGQPAFAPPQQTIRFGQRLSGVRNQNPLVPSQRPFRTQTRIQPQPQGHVVFPPPPLHRKAVLSPPDGPDSPTSGFGDPLSFTSPQSQDASRLEHPAGGFGQPGQRKDTGAGTFGDVGGAPPRFAFVDSRRLGQGAVKTPVQGLTTGREDGTQDFQGQLVSQGPDALAPGSLTPTSPAGKVKFPDENIAPPAPFTFFDTKKPTLVPNRPPLNVVRRKPFKSPSDVTGKSVEARLAPEAPQSVQGLEPGSLLRKPLLAGNGQIGDELDRGAPIGVSGPFNFVDSRKPLEIARQRVAQRRPQGFDSARQPGAQPLRPGILTVTGAPFDGNLDSGRQGGFAGAPEELRRQQPQDNGPSGAIDGVAEFPAALIPQTGPVRQPVQAPRPILLSVERVPVRGTAVRGGAVADQDPRNVQAFVQDSQTKADKGISGQELLRRGVNSAGSAEEGDREEDGEPQRVNPYSFGYSSYDGLGSHVTRHESKDDTGRVTGYYVVEDVDGRKRTVHYVADKDGFRATVHTNEQGTDNLDPASVKMRVENRMPHPPPTPRTPSQGSPVKTSPSPGLGDGVDVPVLDTVDQSVKKS
ncbi:hypothetical protein V5799_000842 [Amblyomma americanum]|uniref:Uncharacterized protein n=1 Tax=Amblyomma americanum TaxID=6943 RepID=A0AAQ4D1W6_AMBAM